MSLETSAGKATVRLVCKAFGISRAAYYAAKKVAPTTKRQSPLRADTEEIVEAIRKIVANHPAWGVRKVWATLRRDGTKVGYRRVWALMRAHGLCLTPDSIRDQDAPRGHVTTALPDRRWATDLTTVWTKEDGLIAIALVADCGCRSVLAIQASRSQEAHVVLRPVEQALWRCFQTPSRVPAGLELRTDHGPQYTGVAASEMCERWNLDHTLAPVGRPTGNAVAERVIRTLKEECIWLRDWKNLAELEQALAEWQHTYNEQRPHQSLGWKTPSERRAELLSAPNPVQEAA